MDVKFLFVLVLVEIGSLIFNSLDIVTNELHVYNAYNQIPIISEISSKPYSCFFSVNYCIYGSKQLRFLKILDIIFVSIIILCYSFLCLFIIRKNANVKIRSYLKITWYGALEYLILVILCLDILLTIILFERNTVNINQCNKQNGLVRIQNLFNSFVLRLIEGAYFAFDLINRQTSSIDITKDNQLSQQLQLRPKQNNQRLIKTFNSIN